MNETIEYLGERFPDLTDSDLQDLHNVGIRFCQPAIPHGSKASGGPEAADADAVEVEAAAAVETAETVEAA